jgi:pimeloyl-ACP methyl ester carboxylesterase
MPTITYNHNTIAYTTDGTGQCIVLLHGFTESSTIWNRFRRALANHFRVITIDLPGFGKSESVAEIHTMELFADVVHEVLKGCRVRKCLMVGHSMGGFVTLAYAKKYPEMLLGLSLFHSHPYSDTQEGRINRERAIRLMRESRQNYIFQFIPSLFAPELRKKHAAAIEKLVKQASKITIESLIASSQGMKLRPDSAEFLKTLDIPVLFIVGMKDSRAPLDRIGEMILLPKHSESLILKDIGHMGYLEAYEQTLQAVWCFAKKVL